ncbi:MAG: hypothetical protein D6696_07350, partial [Acidobacteria bacterium]
MCRRRPRSASAGICVAAQIQRQDLIRRGQTLEGGRLPPFLPLVLYNGERPWAAAADAGERIAPGPEGLEAYAPRLRHALIDEGRLPDAALEQPENLMAALAAVERSASPLEVAAVVARLVRWLRRPQDRTLRRA